MQRRCLGLSGVANQTNSPASVSRYVAWFTEASTFPRWPSESQRRAALPMIGTVTTIGSMLDFNQVGQAQGLPPQEMDNPLFRAADHALNQPVDIAHSVCRPMPCEVPQMAIPETRKMAMVAPRCPKRNAAQITNGKMT